MAKRLLPLLDRVMVEKIVPQSKTSSGVLLTEGTAKLNTGKVIAVGPRCHNKEGKLIRVGDTVLLPEYGGMKVMVGEEKEKYHLYRDDDILGKVQD